MKDLISIVMRTKNEERWITQTLRGVFSQKHKNIEVILVDNESNDKTLEKARQFKIQRVINCRDYMPGKALNMGISKARGKFIALLSGHCIPVNEKWLSSLLDNFKDPSVAGVYGRQEPLAFTSDSDKRDLALVFGLDRRVQIKDSFFHNANSMIRKELWRKIPFDESITNIEDRVWAQTVLKKGYKIVYEPLSSVYHYHGIHQNGDIERCANVVRIMESMHSKYSHLDVKKLNIVAIIPLRGEVRYLNEKPLLGYTVQRAVQSKYIKRVIVSTDNTQLANLAIRLGAEAPFIRDSSLSEEYVDLATVLQHSLEKIEALKIFPDLIVSLEATFPFRTKELLDNMILQLVQNGLDSIITARVDNRGIWKEKEGRIVQLDEGLTPRQFKAPTFIELRGVGCVTHPEFIRQGSLLGQKVGIYEVNNPYSHLEVRSDEDLKMASHLIKEWFK